MEATRASVPAPLWCETLRYPLSEVSVRSRCCAMQISTLDSEHALQTGSSAESSIETSGTVFWTVFAARACAGAKEAALFVLRGQLRG